MECGFGYRPLDDLPNTFEHMAPSYLDDRGVQAMLAYQAGSEASFEQLVEEYSGQVYALLTRFLGPIAEREDLVQEVFLRVIRVRERYSPTARFSTFLYRIAFNIAVNRRERSTPLVSLEDQALTASGAEPIDLRVPQPSVGLEREDAVSAVRAALARLPDNQRMALILAKFDGLSYTEIAAVLDSTDKAVKSLIHRARETLRARLAFLLEQELA